jgi:hypothetical protein
MPFPFFPRHEAFAGGDANDDNSARVWDEAMDLVDERESATTLPENPTEESLIQQLSGMTEGPGGVYASSVQDASFQEVLLKSCVSQVMMLASVFCVPDLLCLEKARLHSENYILGTHGVPTRWKKRRRSSDCTSKRSGSSSSPLSLKSWILFTTRSDGKDQGPITNGHCFAQLKRISGVKDRASMCRGGANSTFSRCDVAPPCVPEPSSRLQAISGAKRPEEGDWPRRLQRGGVGAGVAAQHRALASPHRELAGANMVLQVCIRTLVCSLLLFLYKSRGTRTRTICLAPSLHISLLVSCSESGEYGQDDPNVDVPALVSDMFAQKCGAG